MSYLVVHFPDGSRDFHYPPRALEEGDAIWHEGQRYRVVSVSSDEDRVTVIVEPDSDDLPDMLRSEEGGIHLVPVE